MIVVNVILFRCFPNRQEVTDGVLTTFLLPTSNSFIFFSCSLGFSLRFFVEHVCAWEYESNTPNEHWILKMRNMIMLHVLNQTHFITARYDTIRFDFICIELWNSTFVMEHILLSQKRTVLFFGFVSLSFYT